MWEYRAQIKKIVDGDTFDLIVDVGFNVNVVARFRLAAFDAPERGQPGFEAAIEYALLWFAYAKQIAPKEEWPIIVRSTKPPKGDRWGRWVAALYNYQGDSLSDALSVKGYEDAASD